MNKMKIAIISLYTDFTLNYGNILQSYALNYIIRRLLGNSDTVYTLKISNSRINRISTKKPSFKDFILRIKRRSNEPKNKFTFQNITERKKLFYDFGITYIPQYKGTVEYPAFSNLDFDVVIVGSDVVWEQTRGMLNRVRFLNFELKHNFKRVSYAASFGRDWIPIENISFVKKWLSKFTAISVREKSSIKMLESIGIKNAVHTLDPTLLLTKDEWIALEDSPFPIPSSKYIFVYMLGESQNQREAITSFCNRKNLLLVTIPYASGEPPYENLEFGDLKINNCSPQNWIWLVHHAEYVITDSFHGLVFSTIFQKKFFALKRENSEISNRQVDFLQTIQQEDKLVNVDQLLEENVYNWDYSLTNDLLAQMKIKSMDYLKNILSI